MIIKVFLTELTLKRAASRGKAIVPKNHLSPLKKPFNSINNFILSKKFVKQLLGLLLQYFQCRRDLTSLFFKIVIRIDLLMGGTNTEK